MMDLMNLSENVNLYSPEAKIQKITNHTDLHHNINPDCPVCLKPVFWSRHIYSIDRAWHIQCFVCSFCNKALKPGQQSFHGGKIFCTDPCYNELFVGHNMCKKTCNKNSKSQNSCMKCLECNNTVTNYENALHDKYPNCKLPGYEQERQANIKLNGKTALDRLNASNLAGLRIGKQCVRCLKQVYAAEFCYSMNFPWHLHCLRCAICDRILQPAAHTVHEGLPICSFPCYYKIYSSNGYRKGWQECRP